MGLKVQSNTQLREELKQYGTIAAGRSIAAWNSMVEDAKTVRELKELARKYLPIIWKDVGDQVGLYAVEIYAADRLEMVGTTAGFAPTSPLIGPKIARTINSITAIPEHLDIRELDLSRLNEIIAREAEQVASFDKFKATMITNGIGDGMVTHMQLYVTSTACSFCSMIAAGSAGKRAVRVKRGSSNAEAERAYNSRVANNLRREFDINSLQREADAHIHLSCNCIYRPVYEGDIAYEDPISNRRVNEFMEAYDEAIASGISSTEIRGPEGILSFINDKK